MKKMRILSFMQMAETNPEIAFDDMISELQIEEQNVEAFVIEGNVSMLFTVLNEFLTVINFFEG